MSTCLNIASRRARTLFSRYRYTAHTLHRCTMSSEATSRRIARLSISTRADLDSARSPRGGWCSRQRCEHVPLEHTVPVGEYVWVNCSLAWSSPWSSTHMFLVLKLVVHYMFPRAHVHMTKVVLREAHEISGNYPDNSGSLREMVIQASCTPVPSWMQSSGYYYCYYYDYCFCCDCCYCYDDIDNNDNTSYYY